MSADEVMDVGPEPPEGWEEQFYESEFIEEPKKEQPVAFNGNGGQKTPYKHKTNRGSMFDNDKKTKDQQPDMTGSIDINGTIFWISGWKELSPSGKRRLSLAVTLQEERQNQQQPQGRQQQPPPRQKSGW